MQFFSLEPHLVLTYSLLKYIIYTQSSHFLCILFWILLAFRSMTVLLLSFNLTPELPCSPLGALIQAILWLWKTIIPLSQYWSYSSYSWFSLSWLSAVLILFPVISFPLLWRQYFPVSFCLFLLSHSDIDSVLKMPFFHAWTLLYFQLPGRMDGLYHLAIWPMV